MLILLCSRGPVSLAGNLTYLRALVSAAATRGTPPDLLELQPGRLAFLGPPGLWDPRKNSGHATYRQYLLPQLSVREASLLVLKLRSDR